MLFSSSRKADGTAKSTRLAMLIAAWAFAISMYLSTRSSLGTFSFDSRTRIVLRSVMTPSASHRDSAAAVNSAALDEASNASDMMASSHTIFFAALISWCIREASRMGDDESESLSHIARRRQLGEGRRSMIFVHEGGRIRSYQ